MSASSPMRFSDDGAASREALTQRIRRRNRVITSCLECRRRKLKCDKLQPACTNCVKFSRECKILGPTLDSVSQRKLNDLKERVGSMEKALEDDIARRAALSPGPIQRTILTDLPGEDDGPDFDESEPEDEKRIEVSPLASFDAGYEHNSNGRVVDVGVRIGMFRITERIGGMFRPRFSEEVSLELGAPIRDDLIDPDVPPLPDHHDFMSPGPTYIVPGASLLLSDIGLQRDLHDYLPDKPIMDTLIGFYFRRCHFVARVLHWPTFQSQYEYFWSVDHSASDAEPDAELQALILSILFQASVSMTEDEIFNLLGSSKSVVQSHFQIGTEGALGTANFLRTTRIQTMQALVIYLLPMCRDAISRAHSVLVGLVIRLAECMGLHRDPIQHFATVPIETHMRRLLWFQICYLDFHTANEQGPRPSIRREDYDTRFPLNINDSDLMSGEPVENDRVFTDMTLSRIRFECNEMMRVTRVDIERLHQKKITITHALGKIEHFRKAMEEKYHPILNTSIAIQRYAKHVLNLHTNRLHVSVLNRYHNGVEFRIPDRLREILLTSALNQCEHGMSLYTDRAFEPWQWYNSAIMGWPTAFLLTLEIFHHPQRREADRIWKVLDYVFQPDLSLTGNMKARQIMSAVRDRTAYYRRMRGLRVPTSMNARFAATLPLRGGKNHRHEIAAGSAAAAMKSLDSSVSAGHRKEAINSASTHENSGQSVRSHPISSIDVTPSIAVSSSWTFENPFPMFADSVQHTDSMRSMNRRPSASTGTSSFSPGSTSPGNAHLRPFQANSGSHDTRTFSDASTVAEHWPPPISGGQIWRYTLPSPPARAQNESAIILSNFDPTEAIVSPDLYQNGLASEPHQMNIMAIPSERDKPDAIMLDINWAEWDRIFPPETNTGRLDLPDSQPG